MNAKRAVTLLLWVCSVVGVCAVLIQRQQLTALEAQREQIAGVDATQSPPPAASEFAGTHGPRSSTESVLPEVLRLRSEITSLSARKRELGNVAEVGENLRAQLVGAQTNAPPGMRLPPGYVRKAQARFAGYSTPENTIQSFLWALQQHDVARFLEALVPEEAQRMQNRLGTSGEPELFKAWDSLPGMAVQSRQDLPNGTVELQVDIGAGIPPQKLQLRLFNGEWKLDDRF